MSILTLLNMLRMPIFAVICIWIFVLGILSLHFSDKHDSCAMTYMFEYPQFVRITVDDADHLPQYGLYAYSEGRFTERARKMWFDGVPVLFLPGNSGSHMQARSLASVALRKAISSGTNYHFDFFTISFNEEISGLYGGVLDRQTEFAFAAMKKILRLYEDNEYTKSVPTSVILIGHSMGGVIAKRLLGKATTMNRTSIVITLAAPLVAPVVNFDIEVNSYYMAMNEDWRRNLRTKECKKSTKLLLSFGGGYRDVLVPSGLTIDNDSFISGSTTSIPGAWVSTDHVGIVWCKQVVMAINRFLFSIVNPATQQLFDNMRFIRSKAKMYFTSNRSMTLSPRTAHANAMMTADAFWYEDNRRIYQISRPEIDKLTYLMIRLVKFPQNRFAAVEGVNVSDHDWVFGCNAKEVVNAYRYCSHATSLSELSRWTGAAPKFGKRKLATIDLHNLAIRFPDWTHVVIKVSPTRKPVTLNVDINDLESRSVEFNVAPTFFGKTVVVRETELGSLYYEIVLPHVTSVQQAFYLHVEPTSECKAKYHVSAEFYAPWTPNHEYYHYFTHVNSAPMKLRLVMSRPMTDDSENFVKVFILLDPQCRFTISISVSWYQRLAQLVRYYVPVLVPYMCGVLLLVLARSFEKFAEHGNWITVQTALISLVSSMIEPQVCYGAVVGLTIMVSQLESWTEWFVSAGWNNHELQATFVLSGAVFPTALAAITFVYTLASAIQLLLMFSSQVTHRFFFRVIWWGAGSFAEQLAAGLQKVPLVVSIGLLFGAPLSCGAASLVVGAAFYAFMLSKMYEEYLEDYIQSLIFKYLRRIIYRMREPNAPRRLEAAQRVVNNARRNGNARDLDEAEMELVEEQTSNLNFHFIMFLLWLTAAILNIPALITWARNFNDERILKVDTSFNTGVVLSICSACLWQLSGPRKNLCYGVVIRVTYIIALIVLSFGPTSMYLLSQGITLVVLVITIQQFFDRTDNGHLCGWFSRNLPDELELVELEEMIDENETGVEDKTNGTKPEENKAKQEDKKTKLDQKNAEPTEKGEPGEAAAGSSNSDEEPTQSNENEPEDENSLMYKIKKLKEKISFITNEAT